MSELSATLCIQALALLSNGENHPYILMGKHEKEFKALAYRELKGESAKIESDLELEDVIAEYSKFIDSLRSYYQGIFDELGSKTLTSICNESLKKREDGERQNSLKIVGKQFIKNNLVDYGSETVAQIAIRLNVSKGEVRRRKQNGEL